MRVLVVGADHVDAGKTTFAIGLCHHLAAPGYKPRAGNDYWFDHDDYRAAITAGRLYGKDARRLVEASPTHDRPETINPIHRLWRPAPTGDAFLGPADRTFVLDRAGDRFVVNADAPVPSDARETLPLDDAIVIDSLDALNRVTREHYLPILDDLADRLRRTDPAVIESYGDVARPLRDLSVDRVAVVQPAQVRVYDGGRFDTACDVASGSPGDGALEERTGEVIDLIDPVAARSLKPLPAEIRKSPALIADRYADAYAAVTH